MLFNLKNKIYYNNGKNEEGSSTSANRADKFDNKMENIWWFLLLICFSFFFFVFFSFNGYLLLMKLVWVLEMIPVMRWREKKSSKMGKKGGKWNRDLDKKFRFYF